MQPYQLEVQHISLVSETNNHVNRVKDFLIGLYYMGNIKPVWSNFPTII